MMVVAPPIQRMTGVLRQLFSDNTQPVNVGHNARPGHQRAISFREGWNSVGDGPAHEKMRDRTHSSGASYENASLIQSGTQEMKRHAQDGPAGSLKSELAW